MKAWWIALQLLTRLPTPALGEVTDVQRGRSVLFYPLVGALLGALLVLAHGALAGSPADVRAALLLVLWVGVSGGLHLDGLADSADAWLGGHGDRERTLAIMKDPRSGPAAIVVVLLVLLVKFAALSALPPTASVALVLTPLVGRAALVTVLLTTPYARPHGLGAVLAAHLPRRAAIVVLAACAGVFWVLAPDRGGWLLALAAGTIYALRRLMLARLGGTTGDTLGAACEVVEACVITGWVV
jgi:adenosylcobinamide-GDP ribazoletransferase